MITLIDGDSICYAAGYCEHPSQMEHGVDGYVKDIINSTQCSRFIGYVEATEAKSNFRKFVAVSKPYKGNRRGDKPPWMVEAKNYIRDRWGFKHVHYMESEDACSIMAHRLGLDKVTIAAIDKDLHQIPTTFYDYKKKVAIKIDPQAARHNLYTQILTGDSVDNIPGIPGWGSKKATKWMDEHAEVMGLPLATARAYKESDLSYQYFLEQSRLIYILRVAGDVFRPITNEQWEEL